jgi:hypothetical protein
MLHSRTTVVPPPRRQKVSSQPKSQQLWTGSGDTIPNSSTGFRREKQRCQRNKGVKRNKGVRNKGVRNEWHQDIH